MECCKASQCMYLANYDKPLMKEYLALQCGAWLTWACLTFASVIPSCSFTFARVILSCFFTFARVIPTLLKFFC